MREYGEEIERLQTIIYPTFTKEFRYDEEGRVSEEIYRLSDTESYAVTFTYDPFGWLETATGPDNTTTTYTYDLLGRRIGVTDPSGQTSFEYDLWDNLIALTDAENQRTEFEYYPDGKLKKEIRPMLQETTYEYDSLGRLWKVIDAKQQTTEYGYDSQSRIATIAYADGRTVTLSYNPDGNLAGYSDGETSATYTYDDMGRKLSETVDYGTFAKTFSYTYYGNGLKETFTTPDGTVYTYNYGLNNELQSIQIPGVGSISIPAYTWNRPTTISYPGGTQRTYGYDALMRLQSLTASDPGGNPLLNYAYTYDPTGDILTKTTEHGNYAYGYDDSSRLTSADNPVLDDESYTYDDVGNRLTSADVTGIWNYNANNELLGFADVDCTYDENGNMTQKKVGAAAVNYIYDAANRLVKVEDDLSGTVIAEYYYDPFGRRLWKDVGGTRTYFFYSEEGLIAEYDASGNELRSYGYKPDSTWTTDPLWLKQGSEYYFYQNDHLGTPQKLVDSTGAVVWSAQYRSFGEAVVDVETVPNNLRFAGQYSDAETGLHYNFHRYYDPGVGRYLRKDPIGFDGRSVNLYDYVYNNPIITLDPVGLQSHEITCTSDYTLKAAFLVEYRVIAKLLNIYKDIATIQVDNENVYFKDLLDKKYNYPTYIPDENGGLIMISHYPDYEIKDWVQYPDWEEIKIEVPEPFTPIELMLSLDVEGDDVGSMYTLDLRRKWDFKISGKVHADAEGCDTPKGPCVEAEFRVEGSLVFTKKIVKKGVFQRLNRASAYKVVEGKVGDCAGKTYCCTFEWSKDMFKDTDISEDQHVNLVTNFRAKIHVYQ